jgi:class 3 adenylate cyclase
MTFEEILDQAMAMLQRRGRVTYRVLQRQFDLDDDYLEDLKAELIEAQQVAIDEGGTVLVWTGAPTREAEPTSEPPPAPRSYTPAHLAEKILTSKSALEGERKQITVLFADLKSSMELLADRDPEEARQLLDPVLERMMAAVHRYEGTVNQVMGDGIMALFGAPIAHEDHSVRACYAALAMQEAIRRYSAEVRRGHGVEVQIRVGLNSGEVVVRAIGNDLHMDYSAIGQTTHLAARMERLAPPGSIRLTAETLRLSEGLVQVTPLGPVPIKGLAAPVEAYELVGAGPARTRLQAFAARGLTPFVGRQAELAALHQALEQAAAGHGQVVAVVGEPGMGKTRLFHEFTRASRTQGWFLLESSSASYGKATPYLLVIDLLKAYVQIEDRDDGRRIREKLTGRLLTLDPTLGPTVPALLALLEVPVEDAAWQALEPSQRRQRTLDALKRLLLRESQVQPLLLVLENLQWIDAETQAFLDGLVESLPAARLLLLVNYRPEYQHRWLNKTYYTQLHLDPLPPASAGTVLHSLLGDEARLEPLKARLIERTQGNPFFLEETVRSLVETQGLGRRSWRRASTGCQRRRRRSCRPPPSSTPRCRWRSCRKLPRCPRRRSAWGSPICRPPSSSMRRACSPTSHRPSSTASPSRWHTRRCSRNDDALCMPASSRPWRRSPGTGWPSRWNGWPTMAGWGRCGTRPYYTVDRRGRRPWRGRPTARPWGILSRHSVPSCICPRRVTRARRPLISGSPCARRSSRLATLGASWHCCARPRPSPRPSTTRVGWDRSRAFCQTI